MPKKARMKKRLKKILFTLIRLDSSVIINARGVENDRFFDWRIAYYGDNNPSSGLVKLLNARSPGLNVTKEELRKIHPHIKPRTLTDEMRDILKGKKVPEPVGV